MIERARVICINRVLKFLGQTDKICDRKQMLERARQVFLNVFLAQEAGDPARDELTVRISAHAQKIVRKRQRVLSEHR